MLGFDLGFMSCFFLSDEAFNKKMWKKASRSAVFPFICIANDGVSSQLAVLVFFAILEPLLQKLLLCTEHPPRKTHTHTHTHTPNAPSSTQPIIYMTKLQREARGSPIIIIIQPDGTCCTLTLVPHFPS